MRPGDWLAMSPMGLTAEQLAALPVGSVVQHYQEGLVLRVLEEDWDNWLTERGETFSSAALMGATLVARPLPDHAEALGHFIGSLAALGLLRARPEGPLMTFAVLLRFCVVSSDAG